MIDEKTRILIVEDEGIIAMDLKKTIEKLGYEVTSIANNGVDAVINAERDKPDLIVMDIMLKGNLDGIDAAEIISAKTNIPFVYLTALTDEETRKRAKHVEPSEYLNKPFDEQKIKITLEKALTSVRQYE